jgi:hypothetical protein
MLVTELTHPPFGEVWRDVIPPKSFFSSAVGEKELGNREAAPETLTA